MDGSGPGKIPTSRVLHFQCELSEERGDDSQSSKNNKCVNMRFLLGPV